MIEWLIGTTLLEVLLYGAAALFGEDEEISNSTSEGGEKMGNFNMSVSHRLSQEEALERIQHLLGDVKDRFADKISDLKEEWDGCVGKFSFSAMGFPISGVLTVKTDIVELSGDLPFLARIYRGKIEAAIRETAEKLLS